ncbi:MAG: hypothetical protein KC636_22225, partial [Myxococcales bacterium]|nr:hypothetical protein [Myxococcales bacterium]
DACFDAFLPVYNDIINPICSCHVFGMPAGLSMSDVNKAYNNLVGVPSSEMPNQLRVEKGNSANSYLWFKVSTDAMPLGGPPLTPMQKDLIQGWIDGCEP